MTGIQYISCGEACRELGVRLVSLIGDADPAPWITDDVPLSFRWRERTSLTLQRSLLAGDLTCVWLIEGQVKTVPAWAWESSEAAARAFGTGALVLDTTLPPEWKQLSGQTCHVSINQFARWLATAGWADAPLPKPPKPFDLAEKPMPITIREPRIGTHVPLAEALTWIAFCIALDPASLRVAVECRFANFEDREDGLEALAGVLGRLAKSEVEYRGRYPKAHPLVRERCRHAVAGALEGYQAGR